MGVVKYVQAEWLSNICGDLLSGIVVALALIPESIAFSIIAGVDPKIGLYASFSMAVVITFAGGRPAMISAATGAMALLMVTLVKTHGLRYLLAVTVMTGMIQIAAGYLKLGRLMRFVSRSVVTGFVNALAILIFMAQLPELTDVTWQVYGLTAVGLVIIYLFPYVPVLGRVLPSPLMCIASLTLLTLCTDIHVRTIGDMGALPDTLPVFLWPDVPFNLATLQIILPYALALAAVGLLESMMTAAIIDEMTATKSDKDRECKGQGVANIATGLLGGMAGCAMIGQSVINVKSGGRGRLSTFVAGALLLILVVFFAPLLKLIPMAALVAVMIMVSISTFSWQALFEFHKTPWTANLIMLATVVCVVATHNLAIGVGVGVLVSSLFFVHKMSQGLTIESQLRSPQHRHYRVQGNLFFASANAVAEGFDCHETITEVTIDCTAAHFCDGSAVVAVEKVIAKFVEREIKVHLLGVSDASQAVIAQLGKQAQRLNDKLKEDVRG